MRRFLYFIRDALAGNTAVRVAFGFSAFLLAEAWLYPAGFSAPVLINGRLFVIDRPAVVEKVLQRAGYRTGHGDLLDVDGRIFKRGAGAAPKISINGRAADMLAPVARDDAVTFIPGRDRTEPTRTAIEAVVLASRVNGQGEYVIVKSAGRPGEKLVARGTLSGKIVSARTLSEAQPMVVVRTDVRPEKIIALTFDDGPNPPFTGQIVQILKDAQATATFFMLGRQVVLYPKPVRKVWNAGFQIANHSFSHRRLDHVPAPDLTRELDDTRNLLFPITGVEPKWFRSPYGAESPALKAVVEAKGYRVVGWNVDTRDWEAANSDDIVNQVINAAFPGAIVLMHDGGGNRTKTVMALPRIIQTLRERGYTFVTLDQLVK
ncbi:MAG: polysaccharide deacetylase family protein [Actinomycetota bacterium]|nr:polysaccharide deacetylase family protein [Actinomycetota bacterium]